MNLLGLILAAYAAAAADSALTAPLQVAGVRPDLLLLTALAWLVVYGGRYGYLGAGLVTLFGDLLAPGRVGAGAAVMLGVAFGVAELHRRWALGHLPGRTGGLALGAVAWSALACLCGWCFTADSGPLWASLTRALCTGLYTAALGVPVLMILGWIHDPS